MTEQIHLVVATPCFGGQVSSIYAGSVFRLQRAVRSKSNMDLKVMMRDGDALNAAGKIGLPIHLAQPLCELGIHGLTTGREGLSVLLRRVPGSGIGVGMRLSGSGTGPLTVRHVRDHWSAAGAALCRRRGALCGILHLLLACGVEAQERQDGLAGQLVVRMLRERGFGAAGLR